MSEVTLSRNVVIDGKTQFAGSTIEVDAERKKELKHLGVLDDGRAKESDDSGDASAAVEAANAEAAKVREEADTYAAETRARADAEAKAAIEATEKQAAEIVAAAQKEAEAVLAKAKTGK